MKTHVVWIKETPESEKQYAAKSWVMGEGYYSMGSKEKASRYTKAYATQLAKGFKDSAETGIEEI